MLDQRPGDSRISTRLARLRDAQPLGRRVPGDVGWNRDERNRDERDEARLLQVFTACDESGEEQADRHHESDGRNVIQQQVRVRR